ncbi:MAG: GntR family transcriptional regulator [Ramlibacter sp.]|nr:GntR family transcriptional regulator [Ramlibacter sp.]
MTSTETTLDGDDTRVLTDHVVEKLEQLILGGRYQPGEKLREQTLAEELGVSRGPLREAIRTLEGRRLLERTPRAGVQVVGVSLSDLEQILITREALEGMAARQAAENMTAAEVNALRQTLSGLESRAQDAPGAVFNSGPDNDFHRLIARGSRNRWLENLLVQDVYSLLRLYRMQAARRPDVKHSMAEHHAIIDHIHARDGEGAEAAMRAHLRRSRARMLAAAAG